MDRAIDITTDRSRAYQRKRLDEGAASATINRELAAFLRMLSLAFNAGKLSRIPKIEMWQNITSVKLSSITDRFRFC